MAHILKQVFLSGDEYKNILLHLLISSQFLNFIFEIYQIAANKIQILTFFWSIY